MICLDKDAMGVIFFLRFEKREMEKLLSSSASDDSDSLFIAGISNAEITIAALLQAGLIKKHDGDVRGHQLLGLTEAGGELLEQCIVINWNDFLSYEAELCDASIKIRLLSVKKERLIDCIGGVTGLLPSLSTKNITILTPFNPVYWKSLNVGYEFCFSFDDSKYEIDEIIAASFGNNAEEWEVNITKHLYSFYSQIGST